MSSRRKFIKYILSGIIGFPLLKGVRANYKPKVVVIGGGFGGSTVIKYLEKYIEKLDLILIEKKKNFYTCPFSNYVIGGFRDINQNKFSYNNMIKRGVNVVFDNVKYIDSENKKIQLNNIHISYDWLVLSPGIGFKWDSIIGFNKKDSIKYPIAWSGGEDSSMLFKKINSLEDNSKLIIVPPDYPYRCPPAPYERACLIAHFLKKKKKNFKIIILDKKDSFTKKELFLSVWKKLYPNSIEWIPRSKGGIVKEFNSKENYVVLKSGQKVFGDFFNLIPDQKASDLIFSSRLSSQDWCQINPVTFALKNHRNIHVIGDSINAWDMPKSAFSAYSQAKVCAENLKNIIFENKIEAPVFLNTCYSLAAENYGFSISSWYRTNSEQNRIVSLGSKSSPTNASNAERAREARESYDWYSSITQELYS